MQITHSDRELDDSVDDVMQSSSVSLSPAPLLLSPVSERANADQLLSDEELSMASATPTSRSYKLVYSLPPSSVIVKLNWLLLSLELSSCRLLPVPS